MHHENIMPVLLLIFCGIIALITVFIACELSQRLDHAFEKINFTIDQFDWYLFPALIQRMIPTVSVVAQQPVSMECFGSIKCTRETFKKVGIETINH